jgi:hypothetical protein
MALQTRRDGEQRRDSSHWDDHDLAPLDLSPLINGV